ncbi:alpha/beta fold hydrolase [Dactylosporangium sp. CA-092794]|uniref:alpha/beta fold hydrolase n=1 Tax=Dactylosporangium sp. CA-092794 TaxID=3239929 RepID=UPI003D922FC6
MGTERIRQFYVTAAGPGMYVEQWGSSGASPGRIVFVHGGGHTGVCWTQPPGGEQGWAPYFAGLGWEAYVVDWPGVGRSGYGPDFASTGAAAIVDAVEQLLVEVGPSFLIGHSIGGAVALKVADRRAELVRGIVAAMPGVVGNVPFDVPAADESQPIFVSEEMARFMFAASERFPADDFAGYFGSLVPLSPRVYNALGARTGDDLVLEHPDAVRSVPTLLLAADTDVVATRPSTEALAEFLKIDHVVLGPDWGLPGFGHMAPIERGTGEIAARVARWIDGHTTR